MVSCTQKPGRAIESISQIGALDYLCILINTICVCVCVFFFPGGLIVSMEARGLTGASLSFSRLRGKKVDCRPAVNFLLSKYSY